MPNISRTHRFLAVGIAFLSLGSLLAACGDDDDDTASDAGDSTTTEVASDDLETYCEKVFAIETVGEPDVDFETATPEEQTAAIKKFAAEELQGLAAEIQAVAPDEVKDAIDVQVEAVNKLAETGDFDSTFGAPEVDAASDETHAFDLKSCGWNKVDVTAKDYAFQGLPATVDAGKTSFEFANSGTEMHEMVVIRKNDDTTESFDELLALPQDEAEKKTTVAGSVFAPPGQDDYAVADLKAGEYIALCFIPEGSKDENTEGQGPPHFTKGMRMEFSVA